MKPISMWPSTTVGVKKLQQSIPSHPSHHLHDWFWKLQTFFLRLSDFSLDLRSRSYSWDITVSDSIWMAWEPTIQNQKPLKDISHLSTFPPLNQPGQNGPSGYHQVGVVKGSHHERCVACHYPNIPRYSLRDCRLMKVNRTSHASHFLRVWPTGSPQTPQIPIIQP